MILEPMGVSLCLEYGFISFIYINMAFRWNISYIIRKLYIFLFIRFFHWLSSLGQRNSHVPCIWWACVWIHWISTCLSAIDPMISLRFSRDSRRIWIRREAKNVGGRLLQESYGHFSYEALGNRKTSYRRHTIIIIINDSIQKTNKRPSKWNFIQSFSTFHLSYRE